MLPKLESKINVFSDGEISRADHLGGHVHSPCLRFTNACKGGIIEIRKNKTDHHISAEQIASNCKMHHDTPWFKRTKAFVGSSCCHWVADKF